MYENLHCMNDGRIDMKYLFMHTHDNLPEKYLCYGELHKTPILGMMTK